MSPGGQGRKGGLLLGIGAEEKGATSGERGD